MATMPEPRPLESGLRLSCDSASRRVSFSRFLNAFIAPFNCSFVGPAGGVGSDMASSSRLDVGWQLGTAYSIFGGPPMPAVPDRSTFEAAYAGQAPWEIGRPQPAFVAVADRVVGSILDAGCGTGENALYFASRGYKVTGIDFLVEPINRAKQKAAD